MEIALLFQIPMITALLCLSSASFLWKGRIQSVGMLFLLAVVWACIGQVNRFGPLHACGHFIYLDALSVFMLLLISLTGLLASIYSTNYMANDPEKNLQGLLRQKSYYLLFNLFILSMILMVSTNNTGIFWIAIESSTLFTAFLVGYYNRKEPVEAAWKYIILCVVGIAFAFIGITLGYYDAVQSGGMEQYALNWDYLMSMAKYLHPALLKIAFVFVFIGFGTKAGLAPMHNWMPDAHSEAPTPVSALLSGVLLKCALYGIIRYGLIVNAALGHHFTNGFLLFFGMVSLIIAALFILIQGNIKRLLAYSSLEHIGIISVGLGFGSPLAVFGALFHMFNHALAKSLMFFTAGELAQQYHTKQMARIQGAIRLFPFSGACLLIGGLALAGVPPFSVFLSEFYILQAGFQNAFKLESLSMMLLFIIVFGGLSYHVIRMAIGPEPASLLQPETPMVPVTNKPASAIAILIPLGLLLLFGLWQPGSFLQLLTNAAQIIAGKP